MGKILCTQTGRRTLEIIERMIIDESLKIKRVVKVSRPGLKKKINLQEKKRKLIKKRRNILRCVISDNVNVAMRMIKDVPDF